MSGNLFFCNAFLEKIAEKKVSVNYRGANKSLVPFLRYQGSLNIIFVNVNEIVYHLLLNELTTPKATAKVLGISRNTVKKFLKMTEPPKYVSTNYNISNLGPYKEQIIEWRCEPYCFNGTRIFREFKARRYTGSIGPVYYFLRKVDEDVGGINSKATVRHERLVQDLNGRWNLADTSLSALFQKL